VTTQHSKLLILWTTGDKDVALNMVLMYAINSKLKGWWDEVVLLVWGSSSRLASQDKEVQSQIASALKAGVRDDRMQAMRRESTRRGSTRTTWHRSVLHRSVLDRLAEIRRTNSLDVN
jgi:microcompartment protein CcmK/EutM